MNQPATPTNERVSFPRSVEVLTARPADRSETTQKQLAQILNRVEAMPEVVAASEAREAASLRTKEFRKSQTSLSGRLRDVSANILSTSAAAEDAFIDGQEPNDGIDAVQRLETTHRIMTRSNRRLLERLIPQAEIAELRVAAELFLARARALRQESLNRIEKTAKLIADAADFEGAIVFDPSQTISGALISEAERCEAEADRHRQWASERQQQYEKVLRDLEAISLSA